MQVKDLLEKYYLDDNIDFIICSPKTKKHIEKIYGKIDKLESVTKEKDKLRVEHGALVLITKQFLDLKDN